MDKKIKPLRGNSCNSWASFKKCRKEAASGANRTEPGANEAESVANGSKPGVYGAKSCAPRAESVANGSKSRATGAVPGVNGAKPGVDGAEPGVFGSKPGAYGAVSGVNGAKPGADSKGSGVFRSKSSVKGAKSGDTEAVSPGNDAFAPGNIYPSRNFDAFVHGYDAKTYRFNGKCSELFLFCHQKRANRGTFYGLARNYTVNTTLHRADKEDIWLETGMI